MEEARRRGVDVTLLDDLGDPGDPGDPRDPRDLRDGEGVGQPGSSGMPELSDDQRAGALAWAAGVVGGASETATVRLSVRDGHSVVTAFTGGEDAEVLVYEL